MATKILIASYLFLFSLCAHAQSLHIKDLIALNQVPRAGTDSFLRSKHFFVCESDQTGSVEGHEYSKYSPDCKEEFYEYVTDNYHTGHHITYVFYNNNFYKQILTELKREGFRVMRKHDIVGCKVTDYQKDEQHLFQLRICRQDEGNKYYLSIPAVAKK